MQRSGDRVAAEINSNQRHNIRTPFNTSASANTSSSSMDTKSSRLSTKASAHRSHRNSETLFQNQPDAPVRKSSTHRSTVSAIDGGSNGLMRKSSFNTNQIPMKTSTIDSSKLTRQSSLRYENLTQHQQQQSDKEKEKEDRRRKRNRESARRARERERSERELMEHAYDANEVRIKYLEDVVDELSSELRRHNTISITRPHRSSRSIFNQSSNNNNSNINSNRRENNGHNNPQDDRPSWFGAAF